MYSNAGQDCLCTATLFFDDLKGFKDSQFFLFYPLMTFEVYFNCRKCRVKKMSWSKKSPKILRDLRDIFFEWLSLEVFLLRNMFQPEALKVKKTLEWGMNGIFERNLEGILNSF